MIIAIDGYSATGKSTLSNLLSKKIQYYHLNSGLIYRAISYNLLVNGVNKLNFHENLDKIYLLTNLYCIDLGEINKNIIQLKYPEVSELGSQIAKMPFIREKVVQVLRLAALKSNLVVDGRDIGTIVFPNADIKFFFNANIDIRVQRLSFERNCNNLKAIKIEIETRDREDETRIIAPLKCADDAICIDTSYINITETLNLLEHYINDIKK